MIRRCIALLSLAAGAALAQEIVPPDFKPDPATLRKLPEGTTIVRGAEASASDTKTPLPENGRIADDAYVNDYFGLAFKLPARLREVYKGPPPSDSGAYVLTELVPPERSQPEGRATVFVTAQDQFFAVTTQRKPLPDYYQAERPPYETKLAGRTFSRLDYSSPVAGIHWVVLDTEIRCHNVEFVLTGRDPKLLDAVVASLDAMKLAPAGPACVANYADKNTIFKKDPELADRKFNPIPVRIVIDTKGRVKHVHVISAFPEQARKITDALLDWRFKPYVVDGEAREVETGLWFGARGTKRLAVSD